MVDYPASYHNNAAGFSFADGHAEIHKWVDKNGPGGSCRTTPPLLKTGRLSLNVPSPDNMDVKWMQDRTTRPKRR